VEGPADIRGWRVNLLALGLREIALTAEIALRATELEDLHGDPFDRIIVATALVEDAVLLTADRSLLAWPGRLRRQDARR
jgi:PIN domain nuclease of toxin-antitoxin system